MRAVFVALLSWCIAGCDDPPPAPSAAPTASASAAAEGPLSPGATVVAAMGEVGFREGRVVAVEGDQITFEYGRPDPKTGERPRQTVERARVWPAGHALDARAGEHLACKVGPLSWLPCRVEARDGQDVQIVDAFGKARRVAASDLVRPDEATQKAIAAHLEREAKRRAFDEAFEAAGKPRRPAGWRAAAGDAVVVHFVGTSWYGGKVIEVIAGKDKARIEYDGKIFPDRDVALEALAPQPTEAAEVEAGQFVLTRPPQAGMRWEHAKVQRVKGAAVEVVDREGAARSVAREDVVPMVR